MSSHTPEADQRTRVGGIKLSCELVQFIISPAGDSPIGFNAALKAIGARQINIPYLSHIPGTTGAQLTFCVEAEERAQVEAIVSNNFAADSFRVRSDVATLTVFPHGHDLRLLASVVSALRQNGSSVHGLCTSISALTLLTDYSAHDTNIQFLESILELPENHSPLRQEIAVRQVEV